MNFLDPALEQYASLHSQPEPDHLRELAEETQATAERPQMLSGHLQGRFLSFLSTLLRPRVVVDIGTFTGYSALCLAEGLAEDGVVHTIDIDDTHSVLVRRTITKAGFDGRIIPHTGPALDIIPMRTRRTT